MKPYYTSSELKRYYNNRDILKDVAKQTIKDFALFGCTIEFPEDLNCVYDELFKQLVVQIRGLLENKSTKILSLLYQIDVSEQTIQQAAKENPDKDLSEIVSELILDRELKKVLTRLYFKEHGY